MDGPVCIGGIGGSGTRVVAQIVSELGYALGDDVNRAYDDLWFNLLFYRSRWLPNARADEIACGLELQRKRAFGERLLTAAEATFLGRAVRDVTRDAVVSERPLLWSISRIRRFLRAAPADSSARGWGWKEPTSHLIAEHVLTHFPRAKYVHVIRDGLDMAFSENQNQTALFGRSFGASDVTPPAALRYWVRANRRVAEQILDHDRILPVSFERLCLEAELEITRIADFLGVTDPATVRRLAALPKPPSSIGRGRRMSHSDFAPEDVAAVAEISQW